MNTAVIVAAGTGSRSKLSQSKILYPLGSKPVFMHSIERFLDLGFKIVLVISKTDAQDIRAWIDEEQVKLVIGGKTRSESVMNGLKEVMTPYVYIHDAARPFISKDAILAVEKALSLHDAVCLCEPLSSALKKQDNDHVYSLDRSKYLLAQTPQAFLTEKIRYAYIRNNEAFDDDIALYQAFYPEETVHMVINEEMNMKLTYPQDFEYANHVFEERRKTMRIGHAFDIHQLVSDRKLMMGGIEIPHDKGLLGHSDADVLLHAIAEAMLGALALGDLGTFYPDTDPSMKDISSVKIIKDIYAKVQSLGYEIGNIDASIYAEKPKFNPHILEIRESIGQILNISLECISVKATTYEKLDAIGNELAIASEAIVLLKKV